jgi:deoxyadenosine/deoxycytidine kinase
MNEQVETSIAAFKRKGLQIEHSKRLICIEGNIGAGKTTLTKALAELTGARAMFEPVEENPYLEKFYADPKRYALEMQFWLMSRRFAMHEEAIRHVWLTGQSVIMDRSIYGDWVFARQNYLIGNIEEMGFENYTTHRKVMDKSLLPPHTVVWLSASPKTCQERIISRARSCEKTVSLSYLKGLHDLHIQLMSEMRLRGSKVIELAWDQVFPELAEVAGKLGFA